MKRREFLLTSGLLLGGAGMACCGLFGCAKKEEKKAEEAVPPPQPDVSRLDAIKKDMMAKLGLTEQEVAERMLELEEKLAWVKENCTCATCPSYVKEENQLGFCHPLVGKSTKIAARRGCICPECPVYKTMPLKRGYYCVQGSELELDLAEMRAEAEPTR